MDFDEKLRNYNQRQKEWRDISINQLSLVNNTFTTLATGFLAFVFKPVLFINIDFACKNFELKPTLISASLFFIVFSILLGLMTLIARLYDFRISRHLNHLRYINMESYKSEKGLLPKNNNEKNFNFCDRANALLKIIFCKIDFIRRDVIDSGEIYIVKKKFLKLQMLSDILGSATWRWMKLQIISFLLSVILYGFYLIK